MGDLQSELNSLKWINLFYNSIIGNSNLDVNSPCFRSFGYNFLYSPPLTLQIKDKRSKTLHPDFLLWNKSDEIALIIEVKGERAVKEENITQLNNYDLISISHVKDLIFNETNQKVSIKKIIVGIVYIKEVFNNCKNSEENGHLIDTLKDKFLLLTQEHEEELICINKNLIPSGTNLDKLFQERIILQKNPKIEIYLTETPCIKGVIYAIFFNLMRKFYNDNVVDQISIKPNELHVEFKYSKVKLKKIKIALDYIHDQGYCEKTEDLEYIFTDDKCLEIIRDWKKIKKKIHQYEPLKFDTYRQRILL